MNPPDNKLLTPEMVKSVNDTKAAQLLNSAARSYVTTCANKAKHLLTDHMLGKLKTWKDIGIENIPPNILAQDLSYKNLMAFLQFWQATADARFRANEARRTIECAKVSTRYVSATVDSQIRQVGKFKLRTRQVRALNSSIEKLRDTVNPTNAIEVPLEGGEGKSVIAWGLVKHWVDNQFFGHPSGKIALPNQCVFGTSSGVAIDMFYRGLACGVPGVNRTINVVPHTRWATRDLKTFFKEEVTERFGQQVKRLVYILPAPAIMIIDECDGFKKQTSKKSKYLLAIIRKGVASGSKFVFMSATPGVTVNDMWAFAIATGRKFNGEQITEDNWASVASAIAARANAKPDDNSEKAMQEFRKEFADCYIVPPRDPSTIKVENRNLLVEFKNDEDRRYYANTMERYYEELERLGRGDVTLNKMTIFGKLRYSEEWLKTTYFVDLMMESHAKGFAPVCGVAFTASVNEIVRQLVERGVPRSKISVIQGGQEIITRERLATIIGPELFSKIGTLIARLANEDSLPPEKRLNKLERSAVKKYMKWLRERVRNEETEGEQKMRQDQLVKLRLGPQTLEQRHEEKERFQDGETEYMIFTLSAGGRGIDMDQQFEHVRPREGFFTVCYWAEELLQALYRLKRVATLSNVRQSMVFFANTIVADHVAPRVQSKIKAVRAGSTSGCELADETIDLLDKSRTTTMVHVKQADLQVTELEDIDAEAVLASMDDDDDE